MLYVIFSNWLEYNKDNILQLRAAEIKDEYCRVLNTLNDDLRTKTFKKYIYYILKSKIRIYCDRGIYENLCLLKNQFNKGFYHVLFVT